MGGKCTAIFTSIAFIPGELSAIIPRFSKGTGYPFLPCAEKAAGIHYYPGYVSLKKADRAFPL
jgi:hypothetical protein